jgi:predicted kinase
MANKTLEQIERDMKASIHIPEHRPIRQLFFCPVGLVGAGKTTITKPISEKLGLVRLSSDELRKMLKENGHDYSSVRKIGLAIATDFAYKGYSIAFDMDCGNPEVKDFVESLALKRGAQAVFVHVYAPQEFIFDKFRRHPPSWLANDPQIMIENHLSQKEIRGKEKTQFDFLFAFDTSKPDLKEQIEHCYQKILRLLDTTA